MKQDSLHIVGMFVFTSQLLLACGNGVIDDSGSGASCEFTAIHSDKIAYDCTQTVNCSARKGELKGNVSDAESACESTSGAQLAADPNVQSTFLANYGRCKAFQECAYVDCAMSGAHGYGATQQASATYDCQQKLACSMAQGTFMCDANEAVASCVSETTGLLDTFSPERQRQYELAYMRCASMTGCAFGTCFIY